MQAMQALEKEKASFIYTFFPFYNNKSVSTRSYYYRPCIACIAHIVNEKANDCGLLESKTMQASWRVKRCMHFEKTLH
jgi:hypothetical protein